MGVGLVQFWGWWREQLQLNAREPVDRKESKSVDLGCILASLFKLQADSFCPLLSFTKSKHAESQQVFFQC